MPFDRYHPAAPPPKRGAVPQVPQRGGSEDQGKRKKGKGKRDGTETGTTPAEGRGPGPKAETAGEAPVFTAPAPRGPRRPGAGGGAGRRAGRPSPRETPSREEPAPISGSEEDLPDAAPRPEPPAAAPETAEAPVVERKRRLGSFGISALVHALLLAILSAIVLQRLVIEHDPVAVAMRETARPPEEFQAPPPPPAETALDPDVPPDAVPAAAAPSRLDPVAPRDPAASPATPVSFETPPSSPEPELALSPDVAGSSPEGGDVAIFGIGEGEPDKPPRAPPGPPKPPPKGPPVAALPPGFQQRVADKRVLVAKGGGTPQSEEAVDRALNWLARHQEADGRWAAKKYGGIAKKHPHLEAKDAGYDVGVTALSLLAFLGAGQTETAGKYASHVRRGLYWLESVQDPNTGRWPGSHYSHAIAALAMAEAFGMTAAHRGSAQKALDYLAASQNPGGGWNYEPALHGGRNRNDSSLSGWAVMAAKSMRLAGLQVPDAVFQGARRHFEAAGASASDAAGRVNYALNAGGKVEATQGPHSGPEAVRAIAMLSLVYLGASADSPWMLRAADETERAGAQLDNLYFLYYGTLAMFQVGGERWERWNKAMRDPLIARQIRGTEDDGAWEAAGDRWGPHGGKVYTTALGAMTLEVYYRYLPVYRK